MTTDTQTPATAAAPDAAAPSSTPPAAAPAASASQPEGTPTLLTDDKPAGDAGQKPDATGKPPEGAQPAADYADFTIPDGVQLNTEVTAELKAFAKEKGLTQEEAQKLVDMGVKNAQSNQAALVRQIEQTQAQWAEASRTDKEFGGDKLNENVAMAKRALDTFGSPELSKLLRESGLGNHPEVIRAFYRVGNAIQEDRLVPGSTKPAPAGRFYEKSNHTI